MAFVAECMFCHLMLRGVPEHRLGSSVECPRCHNSFTLAAMTSPPAAATREPRVVHEEAPAAPSVAITAKPTPPPKQAKTAIAEKPVDDDVPEVQSPPVEEVLGEPSAATDSPTFPVRRPANYPGLAAFVLGSFAFLSAALLHLGVITFALGLVGLVAGLVGVLISRGNRRRLVLPAAGLAVCLAAVLIAVFLPQWLGLGPLWGEPKPPDRSGDAVISLSGTSGFRRAAEGEALWVDASRDALHHGDVRLRVSSATVGPAAFEPIHGRRPPGDRCLVIGLRITNAGIGRKINYTNGGDPASARDRPILRDNQGKSYPEKVFGAGWVVKGRATTASIPPGKTLDDLLVFEAPPASIDHLRLELPGSAFGADGQLRMEIPRQMIAFR
jgi:hypothetical protein